MRKLLLLILFPVLAYSQSGTPRVRVDSIISFTPSSFVRMNDSLQLAKFIEADSTGFPIAPSFGKSRLVFSGIDGFYYWVGNRRVRLDTTYASLGKITRVLESDGNPSIANVDSLEFNSTNFSLTNPSGSRVTVNTVQNINTSANTIFNTTTLNGAGADALLLPNAGGVQLFGGALGLRTSPSAGFINITGTATASNKAVIFPARDGTVALTTQIDSVANVKVDSIYRTAGKDSIQFTINGRYHAIKDSAGGAGGSGTLHRVRESDAVPTVDNVDSLDFNSTNFTLTNPSGNRVAVNTIQDIATTSSPTFANVNTSGYVGTGDNQVDFSGGNITFNGFATGGDIYYTGMSNISDNSFLVVGNSGLVQSVPNVALGQVLTSQGTTSVPQWSASPTLTGLTLSGLTLGSVPFIGTGGAFRQNNAKFYWDSTNARLGVGTTTPSVSIEVVKDSGDGQADIHTTTYSTNGGGIFHGRFARGTKASPRAVAGGDIIAGIGGRAYDGSTFPNSSTASQHWVADDSQTVSNHAQHINWLTTPIGSTSRSGRMRLDESGYLNLGDTTKPYDFLSLYNTSVKNVFNMTATDKNTNKTTAASAKDTSSIAFSFSANTAKPLFDIKGATGTNILQLDSLGGIITGSYQTSDATMLGLIRRGLYLVRDGTHPNNQTPEIGMMSYNGGGAGGLNLGIRGYASGGTVATPTATLSGHGVFWGFIGHDGTNYVTGSKAIVTLEATGTWSSTSTPTKITFGTTPTGSTTRATRMVIDTLGALTLNSVVRGSDSFTTTATEDTVAIAGAGTGDFYWIQITGTAAPSANDLCRVEATATGFIVHRAASGTSGLTYNWLRIK